MSGDPIRDRREHHIAGCIVRFVGHDIMDYRTAANNNGVERGGADACMDLTDDDNNGLANCAVEFKFTDVYEEFCTMISLADYLVVAANALIGHISNQHDGFDMAAELKAAFRFGRTTTETCTWNVDQMPVVTDGCNGPHGIDTIFVNNVYANTDTPWLHTAAISGAHTIGETKMANSGIADGLWVPEAHARKWDNKYYRHMV